MSKKQKKKHKRSFVSETPKTFSITQPPILKNKGKTKTLLMIQHRLYTIKETTEIKSSNDIFPILMYVLSQNKSLNLDLSMVEKFVVKQYNDLKRTRKFVLVLKTGERFIYNFTKALAIRKSPFRSLVQ